MQRRPSPINQLKNIFQSINPTNRQSNNQANGYSKLNVDDYPDASPRLIKRSPSRSPTASPTYLSASPSASPTSYPNSSPRHSRSRSRPLNQSTNPTISASNLTVRISLFLVIVTFLLLLFYIATHLQTIGQSVNRTITPIFDSINESIYPTLKQPKTLVDPLPSCSIINVNLTHNLLVHQWTIQHPHIHADCSAYPITQECIYQSLEQPLNQLIDPFTNQPVERPVNHSIKQFRPKWLVFRMLQGSGGLADRLKGMLSVMSLSLMLGRAFAIQSDPVNPLSVIFDRGVFEWADFDKLPSSIQNSQSRHDVAWFDAHWRPIYRDHADWNALWEKYDVVTVTYNYNGFVDLMDNRSLYNRYRTFGFHSFTEKGDMDLYWECLLDYMFRFTPAVLQSINPILQSVNRKPLKSWQEIEPEVPTLNDLIELQSKHQFLLSNQTHEQLWSRYQSQFYYDIGPSINDQSNNRSHSLFCVQLRMGSNAKFDDQSNNQSKSLSFKDSEGFLRSEQFEHIFRQMDAHVKTEHVINLSTKQSLFLTSESPEFESHIPESWKSLQRLVVPGRTGHIDKVTSADPSLLHEAAINTVVTHFLLGECDVCAVSISGFGPTALWRGRNRHAKQPLQDAVYDKKFLIKKDNGDLFPYRHMRGSVGREYDFEYKHRETHVVKTVETLFNASVAKALSAETFGKFQASAQLSILPPDDPMCTRLPFHQ